MEELKPCPFCGGEDVRIFSMPKRENCEEQICYTIICNDCNSGSGMYIDSKNAAVKAWNRRAKNDC